MNPPHNTPVKYMTFICKLGAPVIPRCQQVLAEKRILMKYLLLAGRSIIQELLAIRHKEGQF